MTNIGNCYYCHEPVYAAPGQAVKWLTITKRVRGTDEVLDAVQHPSHKACRRKA